MPAYPAWPGLVLEVVADALALATALALAAAALRASALSYML